MAPLPQRGPRLAGLGGIDPRLPKIKRPQKTQKQPTCCDDPKVEDEDGAKVCVNCGTQISEANIVADVTFQEDSRGAATVQGGYIGENARHARTLGSTAFRKIGGGERNSLQEIENNGRRILNAICPRLGIPENTAMQAQSLFSMAAGFNFNAGRKTDEVVAACLYTACRRQPKNSVMLMDLAELLKINVFRLGDVYKELCRTAHYNEHDVGMQHIVDIEPLIERYCMKLEFGNDTERVATDAINILKRMKRDWLVTGRHPSGLCGACIILAARMNNYRRSVREVVMVAKVADVTIMKRIEEFRRTKASGLNVAQFRKFGVSWTYNAEPPAIRESREKKKKFEEAKRERRADALSRENGENPAGPDNAIVISDDEGDASSDSASQSGTPAPDETEDGEHRRKRQRTARASPVASQQELRRDADGYRIPAIPARPVIDPALTGETGQPEQQQQQQPPQKKKRGRGRPRKDGSERLTLPAPDEADLATEEEIKEEIDDLLTDEQLLEAERLAHEAHREEAVEAAGEAAKVIAEQEAELAATRNRDRREAEGITWWNDNEGGEIVTPEDLEAEFADDPEVLNCLLSESEAKMKEQIWVTHNEDWLRSQHEKEILKKMEELKGKNKIKGKGGRGRKKGKMGDRSVLEDAETPIDTPADAASAMLRKRAPAGFSRFIDYSKLPDVYGHNTPSTTSQSREGTEAPSTRAPSVAPSAASGADGEAATPAPPRRVRFGLESPQATQRVGANSPSGPRSSQPDRSDEQAPLSPPATQGQATAGAEEEQVEQEEDVEMDADEEYHSEGDDGDARGWSGEYEDDREDIGEDDDFGRAIDRAAAGDYETYGDDEGYD